MAVIPPRFQPQVSDVSEPEHDVALSPSIEETGFRPVGIQLHGLTDAEFMDLLFSGMLLPDIRDIDPVDRHWLIFLVNILHTTLRASIADDEIPVERE